MLRATALHLFLKGILRFRYALRTPKGYVLPKLPDESC